MPVVAAHGDHTRRRRHDHAYRVEARVGAGLRQRAAFCVRLAADLGDFVFVVLLTLGAAELAREATVGLGEREGLLDARPART